MLGMKGAAFTAPNAEVLIADDNGASLKITLSMLKPLKMKIETAENGRDALEMIKRKKYHMVFMDYLMPVMNGIDAVKELRGMEGEYYKNVPVIALTATDVTAAEAAGETNEFVQAGMNDFLSKPIDMNEMRVKIKSWLPGDLILLNPQQPGQTPAGEEPLKDLPVIDGIDSAEGVRCSGTKALFLKLLGDFYKLIDLKISAIEQNLAEGLIKDLTTEAHALKSAARMIGAKELSAGFYRLEQHGRDGNVGALEREVPLVLRMFENYKPLLKPYAVMPEQEKKDVSREEVISLLKELTAAMNRFDLSEADEIMKRLEESKIPHKYKITMDYLSAYVADAAMEKVTHLTETLIKVIESTKEF